MSDIFFIPKTLGVGNDNERTRNSRHEHDRLELDLEICISITDEQFKKKESIIKAWEEAFIKNHNLSALYNGFEELPNKKRLYCFKVETDSKRDKQFKEALDFFWELADKPFENKPKSWKHLPSGLRGHVFNVAPVPPKKKEKEEERKSRMSLNGDGMIYRLDFENGTAKIKTAIAKTPCYYADQILQHNQTVPKLFKFLHSFRDSGITRMSFLLGSRNQLNTAFLKTKEHLMLNFDGGRSYIFDPESLKILKPTGRQTDWTSIFQYTPLLSYLGKRITFRNILSAAHAVHDSHALNSKQPDKFYTVNFSSGLFTFNSLLWLKRWFRNCGVFTHLVCFDFSNSNLKVWRLIHNNKVNKKNEPKSVCIQHAVHQLVITENFIIVPDVAFEIEASQLFLGLLKSPLNCLGNWVNKINRSLGAFLKNYPGIVQPSHFTHLYIVDRRDLELSKPDDSKKLPEIKCQHVKIPGRMAHFDADYDNGSSGNIIKLHVAHTHAWDPTEWHRESDFKDGKIDPSKLGIQPCSPSVGQLGWYEINGKTGEIRNSKLMSDEQASTYSLSVCTHHDLCRDDKKSKLNKIQNIYWMSWGFSKHLVLSRVAQAYEISTNFEKDIRDRPMSLLKLNVDDMDNLQYFQFPLGQFPRSPQFVPDKETYESDDPVSDDKGYIVCINLEDEKPEKPDDKFWVFHADDFENKPIYRLSHQDVVLGQTIHSTWISSCSSYGPVNEEEGKKIREKAFKEDYSNESLNSSQRTDSRGPLDGLGKRLACFFQRLIFGRQPLFKQPLGSRFVFCISHLAFNFNLKRKLQELLNLKQKPQKLMKREIFIEKVQQHFVAQSLDKDIPLDQSSE